MSQAVSATGAAPAPTQPPRLTDADIRDALLRARELEHQRKEYEAQQQVRYVDIMIELAALTPTLQRALRQVMGERDRLYAAVERIVTANSYNPAGLRAVVEAEGVPLVVSASGAGRAVG